MGTITRRTDSAGKATYQVKIRRKGYPSASRTFADKRAAETWMQETEAAMTRGSFVDPAPARETTLADLLDRYAREVSPLKRGHAVERIRHGGGPCFLEMQTYRFRAHSMYDPELYRDKAEVQHWRKRDPIDLLAARMAYRHPPGAVRRLDDALLWAYGEEYVALRANADREAALRTRLAKMRDA